MKLNYFEFSLLDWHQLALVLMIFDPWIFKVAGIAKPKRSKGGVDLPDKPSVRVGLVDLELDDIEVFLPPPLWDDIKKSIRQIESNEHPGSMNR